MNLSVNGSFVRMKGSEEVDGCLCIATLAIVLLVSSGCASNAPRASEMQPRQTSINGSTAEEKSAEQSVPDEDEWEPWNPLEMGAQFGAGVGAAGLCALGSAALLGLAAALENEGLAWIGIGPIIAMPMASAFAAGRVGDYFSGKDASWIAGVIGWPSAFMGGIAAIPLLGLDDGDPSGEAMAIWWASVSVGAALIATPSYHAIAPSRKDRDADQMPDSYLPNPGGSIDKSDMRMKLYVPIWSGSF